MRYVSTNGISQVGLNEAVSKCFAPDGSIYIPEQLPVIPRAYFNNIDEMSLTEIAYVVANTLFNGDVDAAVLKAVVETTFNFKMPLIKIDGNCSVIELFHGPTLAYKDISARFFANMLREVGNKKHTPLTIVTATTGNAGGAIANAFAGIEDVKVLVLYPHGVMTRAQLAQFTTVGKNVYPLAVTGSISHCKKMLQQACTDQDLAERTVVLCANTHNILRVLPQIVIFFQAYAALKASGKNADGFTVSIPCGNLSNLTAAIMAKQMGLPIGKIIAGCNANDDLVRVIAGELSVDKVNVNSRPTLAHAMDSGYPTNLSRVLKLYNDNIESLRADILAYSIDDDEITQTVIDCLDNHGYLCDPHTAVALATLHRSELNAPSVVLATAHPAKSLDTMTEITGRAVELPLQLTRFMSKQNASTRLAPTYQALKKYILSTI